MTENEVFEHISNLAGDYKCFDEKISHQESLILCNLIEEIQQYRAIGTVEEIQKKMEELERWHTDKINKNIKNPFAYTSTLICHNCDHKDDYIEELEAEVEEYRAIGTIEDFKALKEKEERFDRNIKMFNEIGLEIRNKAIDEFAEKCKEHIFCQTFGLKPRNIDEIAEELKGVQHDK